MSADERDVVRLPGPGGFVVPRHWERSSVPEPSHPFQVYVKVHMDDEGIPWVDRLVVALVPDGPLDMATLAQIQLQLDKEVEGLLQAEAIVTTLETRGPTIEEIDKKGYAELDDLIREVGAGVEKAVKSATRRRPTRELLEKVLELYDDGGIKAVQAETNYSESYCFKLLRRAREELS
jgi:hypothetical protein